MPSDYLDVWLGLGLIGALLLFGVASALLEARQAAARKSRSRLARRQALVEILANVVDLHFSAFERRLEQLRYRDVYGNWVTTAWGKEFAYFMDTVVIDATGPLTREERGLLLNMLFSSMDHLLLDDAPDAMKAAPLDGVAYERQVGASLVNVGFDVRFTPPSGDQGVDLLAERGDQRIAVQCKNYAKAVGNDAVQQIYAGARFYGAQAAAVVAPNGYTTAARQLANTLGVLCLHHDELATAFEAQVADAEAPSS